MEEIKLFAPLILVGLAFISFHFPKQYSKIFPWILLISCEMTTICWYQNWYNCFNIGIVIILGIIFLRFLPVLKITKHAR